MKILHNQSSNSGEELKMPNNSNNDLTDNILSSVELQEMEFANITEVIEAIESTNNLEATDTKNIQNFWSKRFLSLHKSLAKQFTNVLHHPEDIPTILPHE